MQNEVLEFSKNIHSKDTRSVYYLVTFLTDFSASLVSATYALFLLSKGLDLFQIMLFNFAFMVANFIFEIPTGAYADYFGRKKSIILSSFFMMLCLLVYFESSNFYMFIVAEVISALSFTFASGALDAWMVDSLEKKGYVGKIDFIFSHASIIGRTASLLGGLIGAYIGAMNLALPFGAGAVVAFSSLLVSIFFIHEDFKVKNNLNFSNGISQMLEVTKNSIKYGLKHKVILWLTISSILAFFAFQPLNMYWSPRMNQLAGDKIWLMGWIWAGMSAFMMMGGFLVKQFLKRERSYFWILIVTVLFLSIPILISSTSNIFFMVLLSFLTYEIGRGMLTPIQKAYINKYIPSEQRATILSFDSMMGKFGAALGLIVLGFIAKQYSIQTSWLISGFLLILLIPIYFKVRQQENLIRSE